MQKKIDEYGIIGSNKDYQRVSIAELCNDYGKRALMITCKLCDNSNEKFVTFSNIKVFDFDNHKKTKYQLTNHVNFLRRIVKKYIDIDNKDFIGKKFFAVCIPKTYNHYGVERWGLDLLEEENVIPIVRAPELKYLWEKEIKKLIEFMNGYNLVR